VGGGLLVLGNIVFDTPVWPVDELRWNATVWVESMEQSLGGNGANTAYAAAILGVPVRLLGYTGKDAAAGKLTYVKCYGVAAARARARAEADRAVDALTVFGHEADWLRDLARFVVERTH
jgi:bifunctional ADP-heptose synthase (sugar kinase/adenylyltransferase)